MASLWVISGSRAGQSVGVTGELIIGRENADLTVDDAEVSRRHVAVRLEGGEVEVEDLGSANGTFVDGSRIDGPVKVRVMNVVHSTSHKFTAAVVAAA